jgi:PAS domain S-box-containing protein
MTEKFKGTVLVVDDEPANLGVLFEFLGQAGFKVLVAENGHSALERVALAKPDVLLLDIKMPDMDGFEVYRQLKAQGNTDEMAVIFLSVLSDTESITSGFDMNAVDYITKPFNPLVVVARVEKHLTLHNLRQQLQREITERQQAEADREATMQLMRTTLDGMSDPVVLIGVDYQVLWANKAMEEQYGGERLGRPIQCYELTHKRADPCDLGTCICSLHEVQREMQPVTVMHDHIQANGEIRHLEIVASPLFDTDGNLTGIVEATRDITDLKRTQDALQTSEHSLTKAQSVAKVGHYKWDLETNTTTWSAELYRIFGVDLGTYTPTTDNFFELVHPEDVHIISAERVAEVAKIQNHELEFRVFDQSTLEVKYIHLWGETTFDSDGVPHKIFGIIQDITDQKQAVAANLQLATIEARQRLARDLHDSMTQSLDSLILSVDSAGYFLENERYEALANSLNVLDAAAHQTRQEMRLFLFELQLAPTMKINLNELLTTRLNTVEKRVGIETKLETEGIGDIPNSWEVELFYIAIEALNNTLKHADASQVSVTIQSTPYQLNLSIVDDGRGFIVAEHLDCGMGIDNMMTRAANLGGELTIISEPDRGTQVEFTVQR